MYLHLKFIIPNIVIHKIILKKYGAHNLTILYKFKREKHYLDKIKQIYHSKFLWEKFCSKLFVFNEQANNCRMIQKIQDKKKK